jgi:hypothetical protein
MKFAAIAMFALLLALGACQPFLVNAHNPSAAAPPASREAGFSAFCAADPGAGTCP